MGSWNGTCGLTQLPICVADKVALFLLVDNALVSSWSTGGHTYGNQYWQPRTIQLYGTYDDYGDFGIDDGWGKQFAIDCLQNDAVEIPIGENEYHDIEITKEKLLDWEFIGSAIHESRLTVYDGGRGNRQIGHMAVHRHIFDELVSMSFDNWRGVYTIESIKKESKSYLDNLREYIKKEYDVKHMGGDPFLLFNADMGNDRTVFGQCLDRMGHNSFSPGVNKLYKDLLKQYIDDAVILDEIVTEISKFAYFEILFANMRKTWMPQAGAGSQNEDHEVYEAVNKAAQVVIAKRKDYFDE